MGLGVLIPLFIRFVRVPVGPSTLVFISGAPPLVSLRGVPSLSLLGGLGVGVLLSVTIGFGHVDIVT